MQLPLTKCNRCGRRKSPLEVFYICADCAKEFCASCFWRSYGEFLCTDCLRKRQIELTEIIIARFNNLCPMCGSHSSLSISNIGFYRRHNDTKTAREGPLQHRYTLRCSTCSIILNERNLAILKAAQRAERAGRYEDAASGYEQLDLLDRARELRTRGKRDEVRHVSVNVNTLIDQLRTGGLTIPYRCHSCGATITVDNRTDANGLRFCGYCGSAINIDALANMIEHALR